MVSRPTGIATNQPTTEVGSWSAYLGLANWSLGHRVRQGMPEATDSQWNADCRQGKPPVHPKLIQQLAAMAISKSGEKSNMIIWLMDFWCSITKRGNIIQRVMHGCSRGLRLAFPGQQRWDDALNVWGWSRLSLMMVMNNITIYFVIM